MTFVLGKNDAHILLQNNNNDFEYKVVEIVIGGWGNTLSVIRNKQQGEALCKNEVCQSCTLLHRFEKSLK